MTEKAGRRPSRLLPLYLVIAALVLVGFCVAAYFYLQHTAELAIAELEPVGQAIIKGDWQTAEQVFENARQYWNRQKDIWQSLLRHDEIDDIAGSFTQLQGYITGEERADALAAFYKLCHDIMHVPETEKMAIYNIF